MGHPRGGIEENRGGASAAGRGLPRGRPAQGNWACTVTQANGRGVQGTAVVSVQGQQVGLVWVAQYSVSGRARHAAPGAEQNTFQGTINGQVLTLVCRQAVWTLDGANMRPQGLPADAAAATGRGRKQRPGAVTSAMGQRRRSR